VTGNRRPFNGVEIRCIKVRLLSHLRRSQSRPAMPAQRRLRPFDAWGQISRAQRWNDGSEFEQADQCNRQTPFVEEVRNEVPKPRPSRE